MKNRRATPIVASIANASGACEFRGIVGMRVGAGGTRLMGGGKDDFYSTHDAARICRVTPMTVIRWIEEGRIPAFKTVGGHRRIFRSDLMAFCRARGIPLTAEIGPGRALVIVPDVFDRELVAGALTGVAGDVVVERAGDAFEAGRLVAERHPTFVVVDSETPGLDAESVVANLTRGGEHAPAAVVVLVPRPGVDDARFLAKGASACIGKPPSADAIARLAKAVFRAAAPDAPPPCVLVMDDD